MPSPPNLVAHDHDQHPPRPRRAASRLRLHLPAHLTFIGRRSACLIENISQTGAQLVVDGAPRRGEEGQLKCESLLAFFHTVWSAGNLIGVEFDETIPLQTILELRRINDAYSEFQRMEVRRAARRWVAGDLR
uniref:PilZ domain-containing protein n=1 Tax=uncultured Altererythrobacter sp. TaxID=500840 RepID=UPI00261C3C83|nr:PilZ domain-containing protein [uncultured Altererythrobacter sp.]